MEVYVLVQYSYDYTEFQDFRGVYKDRETAYNIAMIIDDSLMCYNSVKDHDDDDGEPQGDYSWWLISKEKVI